MKQQENNADLVACMPQLKDQMPCCSGLEPADPKSLCEQVWVVWQEHARHLRSFLQQRTREHMLTDDLLSEVLLKVYKNCERLAEVREVRAWLTRIAHNTLTDHYRKARPQQEANEALLAAAESDEVLPEQRLASCLGELLLLLPEEDRLPLQWADLEGLPQKEVAERLGISLSGAKSRIQRARIKLKQQIEACCKVETDQLGQISAYTPKNNCS